MEFIKDVLSGVFGPGFKGIEAIASSALGKAFEALVQIIYSWLVGILKTIGGWWLDVDPVGASADSGVIHTISDTTRPLAVMLGTIGLIIGFVRVGRSQGSKEDTSMLIEGLMRVAIAGGVAIPGTQLLMGFSSAFAPWVYKVIVSFAHDEAASLMSLLPQDLDNAVVGLAGLSILFIGPLMLFASIIQAMMAMGTDIAAGILSALLPITAATSVTAQGNKAFWKHVGWIISCVAFKPAAAIIYGFGVAMAIGGDLSTTEGTSNPALSMIAGLIVIVLACFSLPSMVALVAPMAGVLGSSGGRFLASAGGAAVGAAVVAAVGVASAGAGAAPAAAASTATAGTGAASSAGGSAGAEAAGGAGSELAAGGAQASAEGSGAAGSATAGAGESTGASELGADEASATGGTPGVDADATGSNLGASDADAAGADSYSADGAPTSDTSAPDSSSAEAAGAQSGASTDAPDTGASTSDAAGASAPDTGASSQMPASGADSDTSSNASGAAGSTSSSTGATSAEASGTSTGSDTSASSGASFSSSYSDGGSPSAPAAANGAPTTTNSTYRPRGGTAAHDAARYLQDMTRAIGDETEGAIRPEGAGQ